MSKQYTLAKDERLKSRKSIEQLFADGKKVVIAPYKVLYMVSKRLEKPFLRFSTGVSAKTFKKSVDRNRIKRLTREAYRLQKKPLQDKVIEKKAGLNIFFIYTGKELPEYSNVYKIMGSILNKIAGLAEG